MKVKRQKDSVVFENCVLFCLAISRHRAQEAGVADMRSLTWLWVGGKQSKGRRVISFRFLERRLVGKA